MNRYRLHIWMQKHPFINYVQHCIRYCKNEEQRNLLLNMDPWVLRAQSLGEMYKDKNIYFIQSGTAGDGFFAEFRKLLEFLYYADRFQLTPVIEWTEAFSYAEDEPVNGTRNPFEYYFEQVSKVRVEEIPKCYNLFRAMPVHTKLAEQLKDEWGYATSDSYLQEMGRIVKRYIRLNPTTKDKIDKDIKENIGTGKVLGVHVRGSDFKVGYKGHPTFVGAEEHLKLAKAAMKEYEYDKIFLATDDTEALALFTAEFGERVVYYRDVIRTSGDVSVANMENARGQHHYLLGLEVLRDAYTLGQCQGLIAGLSQVSICANILRKSTAQDYSYCEYISRGVNQGNRLYTGK